jgi:aspartate/methionine/tyrosine aminotransferase
MEWSKKRPAVKYDLAGSNLLACTADDLPGFREVVELNGSNPDGYPPLLEAIARHYGVSVSCVAPGSGAGGANFVAMAALVRPGDDVLVERPAYDPMLAALRLLGANIRRFDRVFDEQFALDPQRVIDALTPRTRLIVVTSPHNPTGALCDAGALDAVGLAAGLIGAHVLVDEVYLDSIYHNRPSPAATRGEVFVSTNSLTKSYGLSGLRAGWVIASPEVAEAVRRVRDAMDGVGPIPSDTIATYAFSRIDRLEARARGILQPNLECVARFIASRSELQWVQPPGGNVAFPRLAAQTDTRALAERLERDHDTAIVPGAFFEAPSHFRIAFSCARSTLEGGLERIGHALDQWRT